MRQGLQYRQVAFEACASYEGGCESKIGPGERCCHYHTGWGGPSLVQAPAAALSPPSSLLLLLLQVIASSIDPSSSDDLQFLWDVWFNAALIQEHRARLDALLQQVSNAVCQCIMTTALSCSCAH